MPKQTTKVYTPKDFQAQANANTGVTTANPAAMLALIKAINNNTRASALGKRIVLWMLKTASQDLSTSIEVTFYYEFWGHDLAHDIQIDADILSGDAMMKLWYNCGVGRYLSHHAGGRDDLGRWSPYIRATTLWISEGDDKYNKHDKALVIAPNLAVIGCYSIQRKK